MRSSFVHFFRLFRGHSDVYLQTLNVAGHRFGSVDIARLDWTVSRTENVFGSLSLVRSVSRRRSLDFYDRGESVNDFGHDSYARPPTPASVC